MKKLCYVVECSSGQYEDFSWWIAGIFEDPFAAEKLKTEILREIQTIKDIEPPFNIENINNFTEEQYDIYYNWQLERNKAEEFNEARVVEYTVGERVVFN